ncbi:MAG: TetR/AcrR family transcriptional regulator [Novosphingobium sp.]|nr:TetR/AcrR family transcriptional regulator [Novosphingobium sp.]
MQTKAETPARKQVPRGRPRDPDLERKVFDVALEAYGREGWSGFNFETIARAAGVGKNALYRRWPTKGALLRALLKEHWVSVERIDTGNLRNDMRAFCRMLFAHLAGPLGPVGLQLQLDIVRYEVVAEAVGGYNEEVKRNARMMIRRAIERGELPAATSTTLALDVITGAVMSRVSATPAPLREEMLARADDWIEQLVELVRRGLAAPG